MSSFPKPPQVPVDPADPPIGTLHPTQMVDPELGDPAIFTDPAIDPRVGLPAHRKNAP